MPRSAFALILASSIWAAPFAAAEEPAKEAKGSSAAERSIDNAGAALGRTADRAEKSVKRGLGAAEKAVNSAGEKTGRWLNEKTK